MGVCSRVRWVQYSRRGCNVLGFLRAPLLVQKGNKECRVVPQGSCQSCERRLPKGLVAETWVGKEKQAAQEGEGAA